MDVVFLDKNYGFSYAVNEGIKRAKGEYVLLLNNDTVLKENFLEEILKVMESDKKIFSVSSKMIQHREHSLIDDAGDEFTLIGWAYKRGDGRPIREFNKEERVFSSCAGAALYRRDLFEELGYFDETFFAYLEDVDIGYRGNIYGYKSMYAPKAQVYHIGSATSGGGYSAFKLKSSARNNVYVIYKNMPLLQLIINLPVLILGFIVKQRVFAGKGFGKEYYDGMIEGLKNLKKVKKIPFKMKHIGNYLYIEWRLIKNSFNYVYMKFKR